MTIFSSADLDWTTMKFGVVNSVSRVSKMDEKLEGKKGAKRNLVLTDRDIDTLFELFVHRTITSIQLGKLCFADVSYETARKRLRKLQQGGYMGVGSSERMEGRGRPQLIYFLTPASAKVLEKKKGIPASEIATGPPHTYHKEHFLQLVDIRLSFQEAKEKGLIDELSWRRGREVWGSEEKNATREAPDAVVSFKYKNGSAHHLLLEIDTGNFRQTRHWEPKINTFLQAKLPIWVAASSAQRIQTLQKWTEPLLKEDGFAAKQCLFAIFEEIMRYGVLTATWYESDGSVANVRI